MPRPTIYSETLADEICQRLAEGESLRKICEEDRMPGRNTVSGWLFDDSKPGFRSKYARARKIQADYMDDKILDVAERTERGEIDPHAAKVAIGAYQWRASKLKPDVYGEKTAVTVSRKITGLQDLDEEELAALERSLVAQHPELLGAAPTVVDAQSEVVEDAGDVPASEG